jgi:hypothetical protein
MQPRETVSDCLLFMFQWLGFPETPWVFCKQPPGSRQATGTMKPSAYGWNVKLPKTRVPTKVFFLLSTKSKLRRNFIKISINFVQISMFRFPKISISRSKLEFRFRCRHRHFDYNFDFGIRISIPTSDFRIPYQISISKSNIKSISRRNMSKFIFRLIIGIPTSNFAESQISDRNSDEINFGGHPTVNTVELSSTPWTEYLWEYFRHNNSQL